MYMLRLFEQRDPVRPIDARLLRDGTPSIGRDPAADRSIPDPDRDISRAHCTLAADGRGLTVHATGIKGVFDDASGARPSHDIPVALALPGTLRIGRFRLTAAIAPHDAMGPGAESRTMLMTPPLDESTIVPTSPARWLRRRGSRSRPATWRRGDTVLISSDGLDDSEASLAAASAGAACRALLADRLLDGALRRGGRDNVSPVLIAAG